MDLLLDANTLIDYLKGDPACLPLFSKYVGQIVLPSPVLDEITNPKMPNPSALGVLPIEPELDEINAAATKRKALSFEDNLCLIMAKRRGWICVSNDRALRAACESENVPVLWGLEPLVALVKKEAMTKKKAAEISEKIHLSNPVFITMDIVERFKAKLEEL